ncbi:unnamed protein product, partial [Prorocentrum cordatum]
CCCCCCCCCCCLLQRRHAPPTREGLRHLSLLHAGGGGDAGRRPASSRPWRGPARPAPGRWRSCSRCGSRWPSRGCPWSTWRASRAAAAGCRACGASPSSGRRPPRRTPVAGGPAQAHAAAGPAGLAGHVGRPSGARRPRGAPRVWGGAEAARGAAARHARLGRRARLCARQARGAAERPGRRGALSSGCFPRAPRRPGEDEAEEGAGRQEPQDRPSRGEPAVPRSMGTGSESACRADAAPPALQSTRADVDTSYLSRTVRRLKEPFYSSRGHPLRCVRTAVIPPIPLP